MWEYKVLVDWIDSENIANLQDELQNYSEAGWELVQLYEGNVILKRKQD